MKTLSTALNLSQIYTNHDIRVTATTTLCRAGFNFKQVMAVTGHRSTSSVANYHKVNSDEKRLMGHTLGIYHRQNILRSPMAFPEIQVVNYPIFDRY